ncbi:4'-phosphopantetheinyl transferase superfamily protein [Rouxiella aceris]|uniref:4'-phosphopantetheinyl transferase family protein n=1 Tax=Rouxiella aceris TaxID=2703884 RepID=UPI002852BA1E|nr:4'-phosphopantetheinyl transferase superfamily protein [Rouxiella aceris]
MSQARASCFLAGRALLAELVFRQYGLSVLPEMITQPTGKPVFVDPALPYFNISHSGEQLLVAVTDRAATGCDIEVNRPRRGTTALAEEFFSLRENQWLAGQHDRQAAFWQLWCLREALLKSQGMTIWSMPVISLDPLTQRFSAPCTAQMQLLHAFSEDSSIALALPVEVSTLLRFTLNTASGELAALPALTWQRYLSRSDC